MASEPLRNGRGRAEATRWALVLVIVLKQPNSHVWIFWRGKNQESSFSVVNVQND